MESIEQSCKRGSDVHKVTSFKILDKMSVSLNAAEKSVTIVLKSMAKYTNQKNNKRKSI